MDFFVYYLMAPLIFVLGLSGNLIALAVLSRKIKKIGPVTMYCCLFVFDTIYLFNILRVYLDRSFDIKLTTLSSFACKILSYFSYSISSCSALILMYISFYRFISIRYPSKSFTLKKTSVQLIFICFTLLFDLLYYSSVLFSFDLVTSGNNHTIVCTFTDNYSLTLITWMDLSYKVFFVSIFMLLFSVLLIGAIFSSRQRVSTNITQNSNLKKDIRLSITSILLNFLYVSFFLPVAFSFYLDSNVVSNLFQIFSFYFFYLNFALNFHILIASNSLFRSEFMALLRKWARQRNQVTNS